MSVPLEFRLWFAAGLAEANERADRNRQINNAFGLTFMYTGYEPNFEPEWKSVLRMQDDGGVQC